MIVFISYIVIQIQYYYFSFKQQYMLHKISGQYSVGIYFSECKQTGKPYAPFRFPNGDTRPELLSQWGHSSGIAYQKPLPPVQIRGQVDGKTKGKS